MAFHFRSSIIILVLILVSAVFIGFVSGIQVKEPEKRPMDCSDSYAPACGGSCLYHGQPGTCISSVSFPGCYCFMDPQPVHCFCPPIAGEECGGCAAAGNQTVCEQMTCRYVPAGSGLSCGDYNSLSAASCIWVP